MGGGQALCLLSNLGKQHKINSDNDLVPAVPKIPYNSLEGLVDT